MTHDRGLTHSQRLRDLEIAVAALEVKVDDLRHFNRARLKEEAEERKLKRAPKEFYPRSGI